MRAANLLLKPGGVFVFVETSRKEAVAAIIRCLDTDTPRLKVQARVRVVTRCAEAAIILTLALYTDIDVKDILKLLILTRF